jgi:hypothetical protein
MIAVAALVESVPIVRVHDPDELPIVARDLGLVGAPACVAVVGGADGMSLEEADRATPFFRDGLVPLLERLGAVVVDGGTDAGVMALTGQGRREHGATFPLVGVVVASLTSLDSVDAVALEPNHTQIVAVPGTSWGDEGSWLDALVRVLGPRHSATVLVNGGDISWNDVERSVAAGRPVIAVAGSGRTADELAGAVRGHAEDRRAADLAATGLVHSVELDDVDEFTSVLERIMGR